MPRGRPRRQGATDEKPEAKATPPVVADPPRPKLVPKPETNGTPKEYDAAALKTISKDVIHRHACKCPNCSHRFVYRQEGPMLEKLTCPACAREFDVDRYINEEQKLDTTFGPEVVCDNVINGKPCGTKYKSKVVGAGGADPIAGTGGQDRSCPKCGAFPPSSRRQRLAPGVPVQTSKTGAEFEASALARR